MNQKCHVLLPGSLVGLFTASEYCQPSQLSTKSGCWVFDPHLSVKTNAALF